MSAGNFLIIALGARFLPVAGQAELVYLYAAYVGLVFLNIAAVFAVAPVVRNEAASLPGYRRELFRLQAVLAVGMAILVMLFFELAGDWLDWTISVPEALALLVFLIVQQFADFYRRAGYVFDHVPASAAMSLAGLLLRVGVLLALRPSTVGEFVLVLGLTALPGCLAEFSLQWRGRNQRQQAGLLREHLRLCRWSMANAPSLWGNKNMPIYMTAALASKEAAAVLGSVRAIANFINVLLELLDTKVPAWLAQKVRDSGQQVLRYSSLRLLFLGGVIWLGGLLGMLAFGEQAVALILGETYRPYAFILPIAWTANGLFFAGRVVGLHYRMAKDSFAEFVGSLGGAAALVLCVPVVAGFGVWGGAWAFVAAQLGVALTLVIYRQIKRGRLRVG